MKTIFLDRDGVINRDPGFGGYITCWEEFELLPGALEAIKKLNQAGFEIIVISNQAGVAKGLYALKDLNEITKNMLGEIEKAGGKIVADTCMVVSPIERMGYKKTGVNSGKAANYLPGFCKQEVVYNNIDWLIKEVSA